MIRSGIFSIFFSCVRILFYQHQLNESSSFEMFPPTRGMSKRKIRKGKKETIETGLSFQPRPKYLKPTATPSNSKELIEPKCLLIERCLVHFMGIKQFCDIFGPVTPFLNWVGLLVWKKHTPIFVDSLLDDIFLFFSFLLWNNWLQNIWIIIRPLAQDSIGRLQVSGCLIRSSKLKFWVYFFPSILLIGAKVDCLRERSKQILRHLQWLRRSKASRHRLRLLWIYFYTLWHRFGELRLGTECQKTSMKKKKIKK